MALNEPPTDPTDDQRAHELARMIDGYDGTDSVTADDATVSAYVADDTLADAKRTARSEGFSIDIRFRADSKTFLTFTYDG